MTLDAPIVLSTFASLARHACEMSVNCRECERWATIDVAAFPPELSYVGRQFRCSCGERCRPTISKPMPAGHWVVS